MITVVGGIKGGSGKTTIATNLVAMLSNKKYNVLLVDGDDQKSATTWTEIREELNIPTKWSTVSLAGKTLRKELLKLRDKFDHIIVDVGGRDTNSQRAALAVADILIAPFQPRSMDVWTVEPLSELIEDVRTVNPDLRVIAIINRADPRGKDNKDALSVLKELDDVETLTFYIGSRKAFPDATSSGLAVIEAKVQDKKAIEEITKLYKAVYSKVLSKA